MSIRVTPLIGLPARATLAALLLAACGNGKDSNLGATSAVASGGSAAAGGGDSASNASNDSQGAGGSGATGGASSAGRSGSGGDDGAAGAAGASMDGSGGTDSGSGGSTGGGGNNCEQTSCIEVGWKCDGNFAVYCSEGEDACWIDTRTDCGSDSCAMTGDSAACAQDGVGDSCDLAYRVSTSTVVSGESFAQDFSDQLTQGGLNCAAGSDSAPEALFDLDLVAGQSVLISEVAELRSRTDSSINAVFSVMEACTGTALCPLSGGVDDVAGILYTADFDQSVTLSVSSASNEGGSYEVRVDFPTSLGTLSLGEEAPDTKGGPLAAGDWQSLVVHTTETVLLNGSLGSGSDSDLDLLLFDELGELWLASVLNGDERFATLLGAGSHHLSVRAVDASDGFVLSLFASPYDYRGSFGAGDELNIDEGGAIGEGEGYFLILETLEPLMLTGSVTSDGGEPDVWLHDTFGPLLGFQDEGVTQNFELTLPANLYVIDLHARTGSGAIDDFSLELSFATVEE